MSTYVHAPHDTSMAEAGHVNPDGSPVKAKASKKSPKLASPKQVEWIGRKLADADTLLTEPQRKLAENALADPGLTSKDASIILDLLFAAPRVDNGVPDGVYRHPDGTLYVVRPNKAQTSRYALVLDGKRLEYVKGARDSLTPAMRVSNPADVPELSGVKAGSYVHKTITAALTA